jgi:hypothetical protein
MLMLEDMMCSTISKAPGYCPSEPTEMPCEPLQNRDCTRMEVELGLKETQSVGGVLARRRRDAELSVKVRCDG